MSKNHSHSLNRALTQEELDELKKQREDYYKMALDGYLDGKKIKTKQVKAAKYFKDAFNEGWDKRLSENQCISYKPKSPRPYKIYRNSIGDKVNKLTPSIITLVIFPLIAAILSIKALIFGPVHGLVDGYSKNKTIKRLTKLGEKSAETKINDIINQKKNDSLKEVIKDESVKETTEEKNKNGSIIPINATQVSQSGNEMTRTT